MYTNGRSTSAVFEDVQRVGARQQYLRMHNGAQKHHLHSGLEYSKSILGCTEQSHGMSLLSRLTLAALEDTEACTAYRPEAAIQNLHRKKPCLPVCSQRRQSLHWRTSRPAQPTVLKQPTSLLWGQATQVGWKAKHSMASLGN
eukprot:1147972-Pelagomonas_calceolata.AAC.1